MLSKMLLGDETLDTLDKQLLVLCIQWVDDALQVSKDFIGLQHIPSTSANEIV